jgi:murein DD-endopeptidase MepM/ murein hydrolase activator NlpD
MKKTAWVLAVILGGLLPKTAVGQVIYLASDPVIESSSSPTNQATRQNTPQKNPQKEAMPSAEELYQRLTKAIEAQQWHQAIRIVDQLMYAAPHRYFELRAYRNKLIFLVVDASPDRRIRGFYLPFFACSQVLQGNHGRFSHYLDSNRYAWDFGLAVGSPVRAAAAGEVTDIEPNRGDGKAVVVDHAPGFRTLYGHLSQVTVRLGQKVRVGEVIARSGRSSNGIPHLHYSLITHYPMVSLPSEFVEGRPKQGETVCASQ